MAQTYLQLPAEQGGTRFGPFSGGLIQIGSDSKRCQIVLNPGPGIAAVHAIITDLANGTYSIQPAQNGVGLFLIQQGQAQMWPVQSAVGARPGDTIVIVGQAGPRFTIHSEGGVASVLGINAGGLKIPGARGAGFGDQMQQELKRVAATKFATAGPFREVDRYLYQIRSGAIFHPRVLIPLLSSLVVGIFFLVATCGGVLTAVWQSAF